MTLPKFEALYCEVCGTQVGSKSGQGAVVGLICPDPHCGVLRSAGITAERDALVTFLFRERVPAPKIAMSLGLSRQRVYQIVDDYSKGK